MAFKSGKIVLNSVREKIKFGRHDTTVQDKREARTVTAADAQCTVTRKDRQSEKLLRSWGGRGGNGSGGRVTKK